MLSATDKGIQTPTHSPLGRRNYIRQRMLSSGKMYLLKREGPGASNGCFSTLVDAAVLRGNFRNGFPFEIQAIGGAPAWESRLSCVRWEIFAGVVSGRQRCVNGAQRKTSAKCADASGPASSRWAGATQAKVLAQNKGCRHERQCDSRVLGAGRFWGTLVGREGF
jgi:hypothetical protein